MGAADSRRLGADAEALLQEGRWVRALARKLVGDFARADDVAQETWLAALKQGPVDAAALRPWLVRVATNFAREMRRGDRNRNAREHRAAREERQPSTSETAERLELQRSLLDALEAIDEPYRTTIRLRYFDGLSAATIARRTGAPSGTVRWRLKRGLELLRERLDHRFGGERQSWCLAFLPLLQRPPVLDAAAAQVTTFSGVWIMSAILKAALVGALALSAGLVVWNVASDPAPIEPRAALERESPLQPVDAPPAHTQSPELASVAVESQRDEVKAPPQPTKEKAAPAPATDMHVEARFVDSDGRTLSNVAFGIRGDPPEKHVMSALDGRAALSVAFNDEVWSTQVEASLDGYATWFHTLTMDKGETVNLGEVVLEPGGAVAGVVLGRDGAPVFDALVVVTRPEFEVAQDLEDARRVGPATPEDIPSWRTRRDGRFRIDGVPAKVVRVWASAPGTRYTVSPAIELLPRQVHSGITLTLEPLANEDTISGIVLAPDGAPVPGAHISYSYRSPNESGTSSFSAGDDGRFVLKLLRKVPHDFSARDLQHRWPNVGRVGVAPGTQDVVLAFAPARTFELAVSREDGTPVESFHVRVRCADERREIGTQEAKGKNRGKIDIEAPGEPFVLLVSSKGTSEERVGPFDPEQVPETVSLTLASLPGVHGRVVHGKDGVSRATVSMFKLARSDERIDHNGFLTRLRPTLIESDVSDDEGRFWLTAREEGKFAILCDAQELAPTEVSPLEIDPARGLDGLEIAMSAGGTIEGRVLARAGRDPAGTLVAANRFDARPRITRVGADGKFRFDHVTPGGWEIMQTEKEISPFSSSTSSHSGDGVQVTYTPNCQVHEGKVTRFDLDLSDLAPVMLAGSVSINGRPGLGWTAEVWRSSSHGPGPARARAAVDSSGRLSVELPEPGTYHVALHAPKEVVPEVVLEADVALVRGDNPWIIDLEAGAIEGRIAAPQPHLRLNYVWQGESGLSATISIPVDGATFRASLVPAGRGLLAAWIDEPGVLPNRSVGEVTVDVMRESVRQVELP